jgi:hypothetical protein
VVTLTEIDISYERKKGGKAIGTCSFRREIKKKERFFMSEKEIF